MHAHQYAVGLRAVTLILTQFAHLTVFSSSHQQTGKTPVYIATARGHDDIVQMLIQANADINEVHVYVCTYMYVHAHRYEIIEYHM